MGVNSVPCAQSWLDGLVSSLPRLHEEVPMVPEVSSINSRVMKKTFLLFLRLSTFKESPKDFFSPSHYSQPIFDSYLLEVPVILDQATLFHSSNPAMVAKMVSNVFKTQPLYHQDLVTSGLTVIQAFEGIQEQLQEWLFQFHFENLWFILTNKLKF